MNPDTLKRAIELAPGWEWKGAQIFIGDTPHIWTSPNRPQYLLDALAAELWREVDKREGGATIMMWRIARDYSDGPPDRTVEDIEDCVEFLSDE